MGVSQLGSRAPRTAFVLGGGGNLGAVQVGMLKALLERDVRPDLVIGCSVGAVNGAAIALQPNLGGIAAMEATWRDPATWTVFGGRMTPLALFRKAPAMVSGDRLRGVLATWLGERRIEDLAVPLQVVATSLRTGRERWLSSGPAVEAVMASAALPAILPPVELEGDVLVDGGVLDNVPITRAAALGAERIVVLHVGNLDKPRPAPKRPIDVLLQAFSIARNHRFATDVAAAAAGAEIIVLPAVDPGSLKRNDFSRSTELIVRAHTAASLHLDVHPIAAGA